MPSMRQSALSPELDDLTGKIVDSAFRLYKATGPGALESFYHACLARRFSLDGLAFREKVGLDVEYEGLFLKEAYEADFIVEDKIVVELKATEGLVPAHFAQVATYLKLAKLRVGLLINFNGSPFGACVRRVLSDVHDPSP